MGTVFSPNKLVPGLSPEGATESLYGDTGPELRCAKKSPLREPGDARGIRVKETPR